MERIKDFEVEDPEIQNVLNALGKGIGGLLPPNFGFTLMLFPFDKPQLFYISNAKREDIIRTMEEFIVNERKKQ